MKDWYSYKQAICLHIIIISYFLIHTGLELDVKNVLNVLHEAGFADADWELLGMQLIMRSTALTIRANRHGDSSLCMIDTIFQWLRTDTEASWEKLADAVAKLEEYGEATANIVRKKAGIVYTGMLTNTYMYIL